MVDPDRRPTAQEIEELIDLVRRDPSSPAFIDLGEAYLALGRPKDAISVGNMGIETSPDNLEGRVMLARAHAALHQWKEAQGELLRVVKVDRSNRVGFALLGEVLLRRSDFERAVPVLQHAQNLDPTSPAILSMLKRARTGQTLDSPAPIPTPVPPRGETDYNLPIERSAKSRQREAPLASPPPPASRPPSPPRTSRPQPAVVPHASPVAPTMAIAPPPPARFDATDPGGEPQWDNGAHGAQRDAWAQPAAPPPAHRPAKPSAPPPVNIDGIRPRVVESKTKNAAAASLRQSAAVGENYLNDLLTGGLLDVAGVRVPDSDFDLRPDRRWGRSTRRAFIFLFVVLVLGIGGGGTWYWWTEKQKHEAVLRLQKEAKDALCGGTYAGLENSLKKLDEALHKDDGNLLTLAYAAEVTGLEALLYGAETERVDAAIKRASVEIKDPDPKDKDWQEVPGWRELVIAKAAVELSRLGNHESAQAQVVIVDISKRIDVYLSKHADDRWAMWLKGRIQLAAGNRDAAKASFKAAGGGDDACVAVARVDLADTHVDDGELDKALEIYEAVLAKAKDHPLAILGRALARAESSVQVSEAIEELNVKLAQVRGTRVSGFGNLALALAYAGSEDYVKSFDSIKRASFSKADYKPPWEPRFWARVAWVYFTRGDLEQAAKARYQCKWYSAKPDGDPPALLVDAALFLASGYADRALDKAGKLVGVRAGLLRAYANLDLGKPKDAIEEADAILKKAPENLEAQIVREEARMVAGPEKERAAAADALEKLAHKAKSKLARHALGTAYFLVGDVKNAQPALEQAVAEVTDESPNPLAYRTHTALAQLLVDSGDPAKLQDANKHIEAAIKANKGFAPALGVRAKIFLRNQQYDETLRLLGELDKQLKTDGAQPSPLVQLVRAEAMCGAKGATAADKDAAVKIITDQKDKQPAADVGRAAAACDPKLPERLGVPAPPADPTAPKQPPRGGHRRR